METEIERLEEENKEQEEEIEELEVLLEEANRLAQ